MKITRKPLTTTVKLTRSNVHPNDVVEHDGDYYLVTPPACIPIIAIGITNKSILTESNNTPPITVNICNRATFDPGDK
jgi:hypothetical protein